MITIEELFEEDGTIRYYVFYTNSKNHVSKLTDLSAKEFTHVLECVNTVNGSFANYFADDIYISQYMIIGTTKSPWKDEAEIKKALHLTV